MTITSVVWYEDWNHGLKTCLESLGPISLSKEKFKSIIEHRDRHDVQTFVARENGSIDGTISVFFEAKFTHGGKMVAHIEDVAVHPDRRGLGIATKLIHHVLELCKEQQCYKAILNCKPHLVPFYRTFGFYLSGEEMRLNLDGEETD